MESTGVPPLVLVVEDDADARDIFCTILLHHGFRVEEARNGREVLRLARELRPAVVLMDLTMPTVDGWTALRQLREDRSTATIPVVALTAHTMVGDEARTKDAGFDGYLSKPLSPGLVVAEVKRLIGLGAT